MPSRAARGPVITLLLGVLLLFVSVIAQLSTSDGIKETIWVIVSIVAAVVIVAGIVRLVKDHARRFPPED